MKTGVTSRHQAYAWQQRMATLAYDCGAALAGRQDDLIRQAEALLEVMPGRLAKAFGRKSGDRVAALVERGAPTDAVIAMLDGWSGFMLSCSPKGVPLATVAVDLLGCEASAEGETPALALVGAMAALLAGDAMNDAAILQVDQRPAGVRLN